MAAETQIATLEANFKEANDKKEQLVFDVEQCRARLDRAVKLMGGLVRKYFNFFSLIF